MKKKMRAFGCAAATVLAIAPFMTGCASDNADEANGNANEGTSTEQQQGSGQGAERGGSEEVVKYGQVMAVNGDQVTVVLGELDEPNGDDPNFTPGQDEITFDRTGIDIVDASENMLDPTALTVDDTIVMKGTGEGADFTPYVVEIVDLPFEAGEQSR